MVLLSVRTDPLLHVSTPALCVHQLKRLPLTCLCKSGSTCDLISPASFSIATLLCSLYQTAVVYLTVNSSGTEPALVHSSVSTGTLGHLCKLPKNIRFLPKIGFFTEMLKLPQNLWSRQQMWVGILLVALLFFNNVFFAAQASCLYRLHIHIDQYIYICTYAVTKDTPQRTHRNISKTTYA